MAMKLEVGQEWVPAEGHHWTAGRRVTHLGVYRPDDFVTVQWRRIGSSHWSECSEAAFWRWVKKNDATARPAGEG
ncbi:hypothetical protein M0638_27570, partial [Roseomonas sp. NAR14]